MVGDTPWTDLIPTSLTSNKADAWGNGWAQYRVKNGVVYLRGQIKKNSGNFAADDDIAQIPVNYLLPKALVYGALLCYATAGSVAWIMIMDTGMIRVRGFSAAFSYVILDNISWPLAQ